MGALYSAQREDRQAADHVEADDVEQQQERVDAVLRCTEGEPDPDHGSGGISEIAISTPMIRELVVDRLIGGVASWRRPS